MSKTDGEKALERTKIQLMHRPNTVFYTTILFSLKVVWDDNIQTAGTDGSRLIINPAFLLNMSDKERIGLIVHEVMHVALNHMTRRGTRHHVLFNIAADHVINLGLLGAGYSLPAGGCQDARFDNMSTEQVYNILYDECMKDKAGGGQGLDGLVVPGGADIQYPEKDDPTKIEAVEKAVSDIVQRAKLTAEVSNSQPGICSGEVGITLECVMNPKLPWNVLLQNYNSKFAKDDYTWSRPNRRYLPHHYLPTAYSEAICDIATGVDTSCSVSDWQFSFFIREHASLRETLNPGKMTIIDFDTEIKCIHEVTESTNVLKDIKFSGRGGTDVQEILEWTRDNKPEVMIMFTDGEFYWPSEDCWPTTPVLWLIHDNPDFTAPFGDVIHYEIDKP